VDGVAFYQVLDVRRASYGVANLERVLLNLVIMGSMDLDQLLSHRDDINARLLNVIDESWGAISMSQMGESGLSLRPVGRSPPKIGRQDRV
jgi:regulator of protease activity HflC (stomatin/prohibitin superfamily)